MYHFDISIMLYGSPVISYRNCRLLYIPIEIKGKISRCHRYVQHYYTKILSFITSQFPINIRKIAVNWENIFSPRPIYDMEIDRKFYGN